MGVTFLKKAASDGKGLGASNKSSPEGFLAAYSVKANGQTALVSMPMLDKLSIHGVIPASVYHQMGDGEISGQAKLKSELSKLIKDEASGAKPTGGGEYGYAKGGAKPGEIRLLLPLGPRPAWGFISLRPHEKTPEDLILRIDWNPRKAGKEGIGELFELLLGDLHFSTHEVAEWLATARISRMDIAVDILDVERCDLRARIAKERKVQTFTAPDTGLETSYHKDAKTKQFPVMLYDKRQQYLDAMTPVGGKAPKFGDRPHCRVERVWRFGGTSAPPLSGLADQSCRIDGFHVRWLRDHATGPTRDEQRVAAAALSYLGAQRSAEVLDASFAPALKIIPKPDPDFWRPDILWALWPKSLEALGMDRLVSPHVMFQVKSKPWRA